MEGYETGDPRPVLFDIEDRVGIITINRPRQLNALNREVLESLRAVLEESRSNASLRALIITGSGPKAFVAGADIGEMVAMNGGEAFSFSEFGQNVFDAVERHPKPVIAAVNGYALGGGCELALACDIRIAAENARFGQPEVGLGIIPGFGGTQRLSRLVGKAAAMDMILSARTVGAEEALRMGLVSRVVPEGAALKEALAVAAEIGRKSPYAVSQAKRAVREGLLATFDDGLGLERELFAGCFSHPDREEGMTAFLQKRKAEF
ncbi:MAG TPA: crotonase [Firmicutes bacterium]|nr:crotonase [Candidatus Fermentithermobacillaceae bacterium]